MVASDGDVFDRFGTSVSIDNGIVVVGAVGDQDNGLDSGSAYVFNISGDTVVGPESFSVTRGDHVSGDENQLVSSDNQDLRLRRQTSDIQSRTAFELIGSSTVANPSSLQVTLEGAVFGRTEVLQTIELFDFTNDVWHIVDTRTAARFVDQEITISAAGDLSRFIEPGTLRMKSRISFQSPNSRQQFSSHTDRFVWTIGQ